MSEIKFKEGHIPLYFQFYLQLKNEILLGDIDPGSRVPTIEELHAAYGVSHATVRKAMALLESEGLIVRKRALGTTVIAEVDQALLTPDSTPNELGRAMHSSRPKVISAEWIAPPRRIGKIFGSQAGAYRDGRLYCMLRLWEAFPERTRRRVSRGFFPADVVELLGEDRIAELFVVEAAAWARHYPKVHLKQTIRPWICDKDTARNLGLPDGTPVFFRSWVFRGPDERVIAVTEGITTATHMTREMEIAVNPPGEGMKMKENVA
jgi:GntR family transcriptional regulator